MPLEQDADCLVVENWCGYGNALKALNARSLANL